MTYRKKCLVGLCSIAFAFSVQANDTGFYLGGSVGYSSLDVDESDLRQGLTAAGLTGTINVDEEDVGWKFFGGYEFNKYLGLEIAYVDLGSAEADISLTAPVAATATADVAVEGFTLMGVGRYPVQPNFDVFAKVGAFFWDSESEVTVMAGGVTAVIDDDNDDMDFVFGLGAKYAFTNNIGVRAEWERYNAEDNIDLFSIGLQYEF